MLDKNRHTLFPKQRGRDGKGLLPRLLETVGSVRMKRQERLRKGDATSHLVSQILPLAGTAPKGLCPRRVSGIAGCPSWVSGFSPSRTHWLGSCSDSVFGCLDIDSGRGFAALSMTEMVLDNPTVQVSGWGWDVGSPCFVNLRRWRKHFEEAVKITFLIWDAFSSLFSFQKEDAFLEVILCLSLKSLFPLFPHLGAVRLYILFPVTQHASVASAPKALLQGSLGSTIPCRVWLPGCCNLAWETGSHRLQQLYLIFKVPLKVLTQSLGNGLASTLSAELTLLPWQLRSAGEFSWTGWKKKKAKLFWS